MIDVLYDEGVDVSLCPDMNVIQQILHMACSELQLAKTIDVCIRFATNAAVLDLNSKWRNKASCTDVLSFPQQDGPAFKMDEPLGDIVLAVPFVVQEASRLNLEVKAHMLHLLIHGFLHLLGHDHQQDDEAVLMQTLESMLMSKAKLHCPYPELHDA